MPLLHGHPPRPRQTPLSLLCRPLSTHTTQLSLRQGVPPKGDRVLVTSGSVTPGLARSRPLQMFAGFVASQIHQREPGQEWRTRPSGRAGLPVLSCQGALQSRHTRAFLWPEFLQHLPELPVPWPWLSFCSPATPQS